MRLTALFCPLILATTLPLAAVAADFSSLEERMSQSEYRAAGLDKLSPEELKSLNEWLRVHGLAPGAPVARGKKLEFYPEDNEREVIDTAMAGTFTGWLGKTQWTMANGQVWQQAESGQRQDWSLSNPKVRLKPMLMGSWLMTVEGCGCSLRVSRIK
jgi:hypothetical protein